MEIRKLILSISLLLLPVVGFNLQPVMADSKTSEITESILRLFKGVRKGSSKNTRHISKREFMEIIRSNNFLCYNLSKESTCEWIEVSESYFSNGYSYFSWTLTTNGYTAALLGETEWEDDLLCDKGSIKRAYTSVDMTSLVHFESFSNMENDNDYRDSINENISDLYGEYRTCYSYVRSKDNPQVMLQLFYVDGVLQDSEDFDTVTIFGKGDGKINLHR